MGADRLRFGGARACARRGGGSRRRRARLLRHRSRLRGGRSGRARRRLAHDRSRAGLLRPGDRRGFHRHRARLARGPRDRGAAGGQAPVPGEADGHDLGRLPADRGGTGGRRPAPDAQPLDPLLRRGACDPRAARPGHGQPRAVHDGAGRPESVALAPDAGRRDRVRRGRARPGPAVLDAPGPPGRGLRHRRRGTPSGGAARHRPAGHDRGDAALRRRRRGHLPDGRFGPERADRQVVLRVLRRFGVGGAARALQGGDDHPPGSGDRPGRLGDRSPGTGRPLRPAVEAIRDGTEPPVGPAEGIRTALLVERILESVATGRPQRWVDPDPA